MGAPSHTVLFSVEILIDGPSLMDHLDREEKQGRMSYESAGRSVNAKRVEYCESSSNLFLSSPVINLFVSLSLDNDSSFDMPL